MTEKTRTKEIEHYLDYLRLLYAQATSPDPNYMRYLSPERANAYQNFLIDNAKPILDEMVRIEKMLPPAALLVTNEEFDEHFSNVLPDSKGG